MVKFIWGFKMKLVNLPILKHNIMNSYPAYFQIHDLWIPYEFGTKNSNWLFAYLCCHYQWPRVLAGVLDILYTDINCKILKGGKESPEFDS